MESTGGATWEDSGGGLMKFAVTRALKQDQIVHIEWKLQIILYFRMECCPPPDNPPPPPVNPPIHPSPPGYIPPLPGGGGKSDESSPEFPLKQLG